MLSLAPSGPVTSDNAWAVAAALADVRDAGDALADARRALVDLAADTRWRSKGVAALQSLFGELAQRTRAEAADLEDRERELARVAR